MHKIVESSLDAAKLEVNTILQPEDVGDPELVSEVLQDIDACENVIKSLVPVYYFCASYVNNVYGVKNDVVNIAAAGISEAKNIIDNRCPLENRVETNESGEIVDTLIIWKQSEIIAGAKLMAPLPRTPGLAF